MKHKLILAAATATLTTAALAALHVTYAAGPGQLANSTPAVQCGPGYKAEKIQYGTPNEWGQGAGKPLMAYTCTRTISDQRPCTKPLMRQDSPPAVNGYQLKLEYVCAIGPG